ncbi:MAG: DUF5722 domain-containing protein [Gaiellaceae bacterium]
MKHLKRHIVVATLVVIAAALLAPTAGGAERMWIGFQDDRAFRWLPDRLSWLDRASQANASILRTTLWWSEIAPTKPTEPGNHNDPAYQWDNVDTFVQNASARNLRVLMTVLGTPAWANDGKSFAYAPRRANMFRQFMKALATRYSGEAGRPEVRHFTIGNEFNTARFLMPQFKDNGRKSVAPAIYVNKFVLPGLSGLKAGNSRAKVAIGVTSPRGRKKNRDKGGGQHFPAEFMQGVAEACDGRCKGVAFAHHPYTVGAKRKGPNAQFRYPAVAFNNLTQFNDDLKLWFDLEHSPRIWITEYGFFSNPPNTSPLGIPLARQARFLQQAVKKAKKLDYVDMFIWFILLDDRGAPNPVVWEASGGLYNTSDEVKPAYAAYQNIAATVTRPDSEVRPPKVAKPGKTAKAPKQRGSKRRGRK